MKKKQYICPKNEVVRFATSLMEAFGPASMPSSPFSSSAPKHRTPAF